MFAVSRDGVVDNNMVVQLAVTKDGVIGGTVMDQATGKTFDVEGTVDKQTQRAVWSYKNEARPRDRDGDERLQPDAARSDGDGALRSERP